MPKTRLAAAAAAALMVAPAVATAHFQNASADCDAATINYSSHPVSTARPGIATWRVLVDAVEVSTGDTTYTTSRGSITVPLVLGGAGRLRVEFTLRSDRVDTAVVDMAFECAVPPPPVDDVPPPPPPSEEPDPTPPSDTTPIPPLPPGPPAKPPLTCADLIRAKAGLKTLIARGCVTKTVTGKKCPKGWTTRVVILPAGQGRKVRVRVRTCIPPKRYSPPVTG